MIYTHVLNKPDLGIRSPIDDEGPSPSRPMGISPESGYVKKCSPFITNILLILVRCRSLSRAASKSQTTLAVLVLLLS